MVSYNVPHTETDGKERVMKLIPLYAYTPNMHRSSVEALSDLSRLAGDGLVLRVRTTIDHVPVVMTDPSMADLCLCEERVDALSYREIDALAQLSGFHVLTLEALLGAAQPTVPMVIHFRGFRPDAYAVSRVTANPLFSFATDSAQQLSVIASAYKEHKTTGFASRLSVAAEMLRGGAARVCLYGRGLAQYTKEMLSPLTAASEVWLEMEPHEQLPLDEAVARAEALGCRALVLPLELIR